VEYNGKKEVMEVDVSSREKLVASVVVPGNMLPVLEHPEESGSLLGQACRTGYQSHFTMVDGTKESAPLVDGIDETIAADELIVFEGSYALPLFVFYKK